MNNTKIKHLSYSGIRTFLTNKFEFYKTYIEGIRNFATSEAMFIGNIYHNILEEYYSCDDQAIKDSGEIWDNLKGQIKTMIHGYIDEKKTTFEINNEKQEEKIIGQLERLIEFYKEFGPCYKKESVLGVEQRFQNEMLDTGFDIKGFIDLVIKEGDDIILVDHKSVTSFSKDVTPGYMIQACIYMFGYINMTGNIPKKMYFDEMKKSKNRSGGTQLNRITVEYNEEIIRNFVRLFYNIITQIKSYEDNMDWYLPNPFDMNNGQQTWFEYNLALENNISIY